MLHRFWELRTLAQVGVRSQTAAGTKPLVDLRGDGVGSYVLDTAGTAHVVTDASSRRLRGTDGWISLILATEGRANVEAIDT